MVYGPQNVADPASQMRGPVAYAGSLAEGRQSPRAGANPLFARAIVAGGGRQGDLCVSRRDAERILAAARQAGFLAKAGVVVVRAVGTREALRQAGQRHAVVVGINNYPAAKVGAPLSLLEFAVRDAEAPGNVLVRAGGFDPSRVKIFRDADATRERIVEYLRNELRQRVREEDAVIFFSSGQGVSAPGRSSGMHYYLIPHDGRLDDLPGTAIGDEPLEELLNQLPARRVVLLLDACYSGGVVGAGRGRAKGITLEGAPPPPPLRAFVEANGGRVLISSSLPDQLSFEDRDGGQGVFTKFLIEAVGGAADLGGKGAVTVLEAYQSLAARVPEYARKAFAREQTPVLEVRGLSGEIVLTRR